MVGIGIAIWSHKSDRFIASILHQLFGKILHDSYTHPSNLFISIPYHTDAWQTIHDECKYKVKLSILSDKLDYSTSSRIKFRIGHSFKYVCLLAILSVSNTLLCHEIVGEEGVKTIWSNQGSHHCCCSGSGGVLELYSMAPKHFSLHGHKSKQISTINTSFIRVCGETSNVYHTER